MINPQQANYAPFVVEKKELFYAKAFSRNEGLIHLSEQQELRNCRVGIAGLGGIGSTHLITLVRLGIENFHLADIDHYDVANINRQYGAKNTSVGEQKIKVMVKEALDINPYLTLKTFDKGIQKSTIDAFLDGVQIVLDGLDIFAMQARILLFRRAREKGIPVITTGPIGFGAPILVFTPKSMSFSQYFQIKEEMTETEKTCAFLVGMAPNANYLSYVDLKSINLQQKAGPSLGLACQLSANMAATEIVRILLKRNHLRPAPYYTQFDPYLRKYTRGYLPWGNRNPLQRLRLTLFKRHLLKSRKTSEPKQPDRPLTRMDKTTKELPGEIMQYLLRAGIQAPSGDNAQPWRLSTEQMKISIECDTTRDSSFFNVAQRASLLACGAALENIRIAANSFGLVTSRNYFPNPEQPFQIVDIQLRQGSVKKEQLEKSIWKRATDRSMYQKRPALPSTLETLNRSIQEFPGAQLHFLTEPKSLHQLHDAVWQADRLRIRRKDLHEHLQSMIRFTQVEVNEKGDGMPIKNLQVGMLGELFLTLSRSWSVAKWFPWLGLDRALASIATRGLLHCSGVGFLTMPSNSKRDFVIGGQAFQRLWLELTKLGLSAQPIAALPFFLTRLQLEGDIDFTKKEMGLLNIATDKLQALFPTIYCRKNGLIMLFRFGYGKPVDHKTPRRT